MSCRRLVCTGRGGTVLVRRSFGSFTDASPATPAPPATLLFALWRGLSRRGLVNLDWVDVFFLGLRLGLRRESGRLFLRAERPVGTLAGLLPWHQVLGLLGRRKIARVDVGPGRVICV